MNIASSFTDQFCLPGGSGHGFADGAAFVLQNSPSRLAALGASGGGLGYLGMTPSAAIQFNIFTGGGNPDWNHLRHRRFASVPLRRPPRSIRRSGNPIQVTLSYDGSNLLVETLLDTFSTNSYHADLLGRQLGRDPWRQFGFRRFHGRDGRRNRHAVHQQLQLYGHGSAHNILPAATA